MLGSLHFPLALRGSRFSPLTSAVRSDCAISQTVLIGWCQISTLLEPHSANGVLCRFAIIYSLLEKGGTMRLLTLFEQTCHDSSISNAIQEAGYKILMWWYGFPAVLHRMYPGVPDVCWCCHRQRRMLLHIFWECPMLQMYWYRVAIAAITDARLERKPETCLLHLMAGLKRAYKRSLQLRLINTARGCIPRLWKQTPSSTIAMWFQSINDVMTMEKLTATLNDRYD